MKQPTQQPLPMTEKPFLDAMADSGNLRRVMTDPEAKHPANNQGEIGMEHLAARVQKWRREEGDGDLPPTDLPRDRLMPLKVVPEVRQRKMLRFLEDYESQGMTYRQVLEREGLLMPGKGLETTDPNEMLEVE